jgi:hypothetical protein
LLAFAAFIASDIALNAPSLLDPGLSHGQRLASVIFLVTLPASAAFLLARFGPWAARAIVSALVATLAYVVALVLGLSFALNAGLLVP